MLTLCHERNTKTKSVYLADVIRQNEERQTRNEEVLDLDASETRDRWNATPVTTHERLLPFNDNLTTLMFVVASDLSEAQRERLSSSLSLQGVNVTAYTFGAERTVFVELFCTPKSAMENPSLRVNRYGGQTGRKFIVENVIEDEFGQWATDEKTGEQGYVDDEGSCFWTWNNNECAWKSRLIQEPQIEEKRKRLKKGQRWIKRSRKSIPL